MAETDVVIDTDVAHFVLFHPEDLQHRDDHPIAWYAYDFIYGPESAAGRLIAWGTGSDGGFRVRMTTGGLHPEEEQAALAPWHFPYIVRHKRVLLDNTDALPGLEKMTEPDDLDGKFWLVLDNGVYRVSVFPIDRSDNGELPDYVVTFAAVESMDGIAPSATPPLLEPFRGRDARAQASFESESALLWPQKAPDSTDELLGLKIKAGTKMLPRISTRLACSEPIAEAIFPSDFSRRESKTVLATALAVGQLGILARPHGRSQRGDDLPVIDLFGEALVRIETVALGAFLPVLSVKPVGKPDMTAPEVSVARLREGLVLAIREERLQVGRFERDRMESLGSAEALSTWALQHLELPFDRRLALYGATAEQRIQGILAALAL